MMVGTCRNLIVTMCIAACMAQASAKELKVLIIGNSFSKCVLREWPLCA